MRNLHSETITRHIMTHGTDHVVNTTEVKAKVRDMGFKEKAEFRMGMGEVLVSVSLPKEQCLQADVPFTPARSLSITFDDDRYEIIDLTDFGGYWRMLLRRYGR